MKKNTQEYTKYYEEISNIKVQSTEINSKMMNPDKNPINKEICSCHYLCPNCLKFPFIKFCKDKKNIRLTCSCFNNKKILIKDLFNSTHNYKFIETNFLNNENNYGDGLFCQDHNEKYLGFCKECLNNFCNKSFNYHNNLNHSIINFKDIAIDDEKINQLLKYINSISSNHIINNTKSSEEIFNLNDNSKIQNINNALSEMLSEEEQIS